MELLLVVWTLEVIFGQIWEFTFKLGRATVISVCIINTTIG